MFNSIQSELNDIFVNLEKDYSLKSGHLSKYIPDYEVSKIDKLLRPALVALSAKLFQGYDRRSMVIGEVIQLIHLAQDIHNHITDDCPKEKPQFPVLVGDYLFSKFFKKLSDHDLLEYLAPLASVICKMNEGGIIRREIIEQGRAREKDYLDVLLMEYGLLMGMACKVGGNLAGCSEEKADNLEQFGINLGMAWGAIKEKYPLAPENFLNMARNILMKISVAEEREDMMNIIDFIDTMTMTGDGSLSCCG